MSRVESEMVETLKSATAAIMRLRREADVIGSQMSELETRLENCETEGAIDRVRLSQVWDTLEGVLDCLEVISAEWPERDGVRLRSVVTTAREVFGDE